LATWPDLTWRIYYPLQNWSLKVVLWNNLGEKMRGDLLIQVHLETAVRMEVSFRWDFLIVSQIAFSEKGFSRQHQQRYGCYTG